MALRRPGAAIEWLWKAALLEERQHLGLPEERPEAVMAIPGRLELPTYGLGNRRLH